MKKTYNIGYITGCFDLPHKAHFFKFQRAKQICNILIVGLTTDEQYKKEKGTLPILSFDHRTSILQNCQYVDVVVANRGDGKVRDLQKLRFDVLFSSDEYYGSDEFEIFSKECPSIPVMFLSRTDGVSTSRILSSIETRFAQNISLFIMSLTGPILRIGNTIIKPIHIGFSEQKSTANVYDFPFPNLPRNWKHHGKEEITYPMITGVNSNRELQIIQHLQPYAWNPIRSCKFVHRNTYVTEHEPVKPNFEHVQRERKRPFQIWWVFMNYAGPTLDQWITSHETEDNFMALLMPLIHQVKTITKVLKEQKIIHGDMHSRNLCVLDGHVSVIDWGWCHSPMFEMEMDEFTYVKECLKSDWDWTHFTNSLQFMYKDRPWWDQLVGTK